VDQDFGRPARLEVLEVRFARLLEETPLRVGKIVSTNITFFQNKPWYPSKKKIANAKNVFVHII